MKCNISVFIFILFANISFAQKQTTNYRSGEILVKLKKEVKVEVFLLEYNSKEINTPLFIKKPIHIPSGIYLFGYENLSIDINDLVKSLTQESDIAIANVNRYTHHRNTEPNDPIFEDQWHLDIIQAPEAWDITTGGLTPQGDTIVVAVLDGGCELSHEDLQDNLWRNWDEIPNDGIDNDGNGYIDDHFGLNTLLGNDKHPAERHGTSVAGIIGAKGDNGKGLTGLNWNIKLMILSNVRSEAEVVEAYMYALEQRKKYIETNGAEGAFVVATNYSLGLNFIPCSVFPLWNMAIDSLGMVGVLSAGAVPNQNVNIDLVGDTPGTCESEFLITVTNTNQSDEKVLSAGYGSINLDMGAPGSGSLTTVLDSKYGTFAGASAATPHVAGAIALLYSTPCSGLTIMAKSNPKEAARTVKQLLMDGTDPLPDLAGNSVSGGRLNVFRSIELMQETFAQSRGELIISGLRPNPATNTLFISYTTPELVEYDLQIFDAAGRLVIHEILPLVCGLNPYPVNITKLNHGTYFVRIYNGETYVTDKFIVY